MRVIHVIARLNLGGAALSVLELAAEQQRRGHDVLVVAGRIPDGEESMAHVADELGVPHLYFPQLQRELSLRTDAAAVRGLRSLIRQRRPDVLHTHTSKAGATGRVAALLAGAARPRATVHHFHGHVLTEYFSPARQRLFRSIERVLARNTGAIVAVSDEVKEDLVRLGVAARDKIHVVTYGFDLDRRSGPPPRRRQDFGIVDDAFVIGWAGRLTPIKRPLDLVRVAAVVEDATLLLAGDGELRPDVESLAAELGVDERMRLLGYVDDVASIYASSDVFLLSSANEGTPVVAIEALAAGVPVVATRAGGTATVVDDGETGFLVPVADVSALADRVRALREDAERRRAFGERGARLMRERFSTARMADAIERIYAELLGR